MDRTGQSIYSMSVRYKSTRGVQGESLSFEDVVLGGLASDKGLFVPESIPTFSLEEINKMRGLSFSALAFEVISKFVGPDQIPSDLLLHMVYGSYSTFRTAEVTPLVKLKDFWVLELFHGPTFAFKDVALQFLGNIFEYFLTRGNIQQSVTVLGATSGDTGSAAIHGLRGKKNVNCFIMFPAGKVTEIQERQMTTIPDENVHCLSVEGDFDDAQALVKAAFADEQFRNEVNLGAVNSINWARVLAQITYYFYAYLRATDKVNAEHSAKRTAGKAVPPLPKAVFAVPTGNFGDILAGYYAQRMGLPVERLMVCTNDNDVLHRFLQTGEYRKMAATATLAPSMDISVSSNFERYLYYLADENPALLSAWMDTFETTGVLKVPVELLLRAQRDFSSHSSSENEICSAMSNLYREEGYLVCPHTATAVAGIKHLASVPVVTAPSPVPLTAPPLLPAVRVCLATAHPAKFEAAVERALGIANGSARAPPRPIELELLLDMPTRKDELPNSLSHVQEFIRARI